MKTFDIIFFRGAEGVSSFISWIQKKLHGNGAQRFTHVGMIIRGEDFPFGSPFYAPDKIYVFESTQSGSLGDGTENVHFKSILGVQLRNLDRVAETYDAGPNSKMAWGKMREEIRPPPTMKRAELLLIMIRKYQGLRYDASFIDLTASLFKFMRGIRSVKNSIMSCGSCNQKNWIFCSELVANIYKDFNLLPVFVNPENVLPCDFLENPWNPGKTFDGEKLEEERVPLLFEFGGPVLFTTYHNIIVSKQ